jgi:hypothetical protein
MEIVGGKEEEDPVGDPEDQRRCRRLTLAPSVSSFELASVEDAIDVGSDKVFSDNLKNGRMSSFVLANADGVSQEILRSSAHLLGDELQAHVLSSAALLVGDRWEEDEPSSVIVSLSEIVESMPVTDHGNAKIIVRSSSQDIAGSPPALNNSLNTDKLRTAAGGRRGFRVKPWRGPLPRARPASVTVLGDFLPKHFVDHHGCSDQVSKTPQAACLVSIGTDIGSCTGAALSQTSLRERAKAYGRPKIDLKLTRGKRLGKTLTSFPSDQPSAPKPSLLPGSKVLPTSSCRVKGLSYAEMAARPPPQSGAQRAPPQLHNGGGQQRLTQQQAGRPAPEWNRGRSMTGRIYGRPPVGRGRPGPPIFGQNERRREWRQSNREDRQMGPGGTQRADQRTEGHAVEIHQNQRQVQINLPEPNPDVAQKVKKPRPPFCFRCKCSGHTAEECTAMLDCVVCNKKDSHLSRKCPLTKMAKPQSTLFGTGANDFSFLKIPDFDFKLEAPNPEPTALVTITGGKLSSQLLKAELAKLMRLDWNWEALPHGEDSFLVPFPSREELIRMNDVEFKLKNHGVELTFNEWKEGEDASPAYELDLVWFHITGIPHAWRHYLTFWALGTVVGSTQQVDMHTYRQKGVVRVQVGILNRDQFPYTTDLVFGTKGYEITFALEKEDFIPADLPLEDHRSKEDSGNGTEGRSDSGNMQNRDKKQKNDSSSSDKNSGSSSGPVPMQIALTPFPKGVDTKKILQYRRQRTSRVEGKISGSENLSSAKSSLSMEAKVSAMYSESQSVEGAAGLQPDLIQGKGEQNFSSIDKMRTNVATRVQAEEKPGCAALSLADGTTDGNKTELVRLEAISGTVQSTKRCILNGTKEPASRPASKSSLVDCGPKEKSNTGQSDRSTATNPTGNLVAKKYALRRSKRLNNNCSSDGISKGDEDMLEKSMKRTAWKNLDGPALQQPSPVQSKSKAISIFESLPTDRCVDNLQRLGFSMGSSKQESTLAIKALKRIDIDRTKVEPKLSAPNNLMQPDLIFSDLSDDEDSRSDSVLLAHLAKDISEIGLEDDDLDIKICDLMAHSRKSKVSRKKGHNSNKNRFPNERIILE